jgi:hypothetical protein
MDYARQIALFSKSTSGEESHGVGRRISRIASQANFDVAMNVI